MAQVINGNKMKMKRDIITIAFLVVMSIGVGLLIAFLGAQRMKRLLLFLLIGCSSYGQYSMTNVVYRTDFATSSTGYVWTTNGNGTGPVINETGYWATILAGQDGWVSNQQYEPLVAGPGLNEYATSYNVGNWKPTFAAIGGDAYGSTETGIPFTYPQNITNNWIRPFSNNTNSVYFQAKFAVNATAPNANGLWDTFAFTLFNTQTNPLFSINLNAADDFGDYWKITYSTYGHNGTNNVTIYKANGTRLANLQNMQLAYLGFDIIGLGTTNQQMIMYNTYTTNSMGLPTIIGTNALIGSDYSGIDTTITALAATWTIRDTTTSSFVDGTNVVTVYPGYADNTLLIENVAIATVVPEPPIWILLSLTCVVVILRQRNKKLEKS